MAFVQPRTGQVHQRPSALDEGSLGLNLARASFRGCTLITVQAVVVGIFVAIAFVIPKDYDKAKFPLMLGSVLSTVLVLKYALQVERCICRSITSSSQVSGEGSVTIV